MNCRFCHTELHQVFVDLDFAPISNAMLTQEQLSEPELYFPLKIFVCDSCRLVQVDEMQKADRIFDADYTYFSSYSTSWLQHAKRYVEMMVERFGFSSGSQVIEIASNDGYLLQYFRELGVPVLGVEPTANTAQVAIDKGIPTMVEFFSTAFAERQLAGQGIKGDLILGNNVLAHVPDINDFVGGIKAALNDGGVVTMEFPHLLKLVAECQFDTIYHEHFSYLSFFSVNRIFNAHGLELFDVEELPTHGGSLRIFAKHADDAGKPVAPAVQQLLDAELQAGVDDAGYYADFQRRVDAIKYGALEFLLQQKRAGKRVAAYGAASKGNTFLNYCGIKGSDLIAFVVDASPHKQNKYLPGSHIAVVSEEQIRQSKPDYVIILPWNLTEEISGQLDYIREWGGRFVVFIPELREF
ncbi:MAG: class I SAM-dependent methyltransferase [Pseudomonadota bacterium]